MTGSWRRTRGRSLAVFGAFATVAIVSALIALGAVTSALLLTAAADVLAPTWADEVAAITLSVAQVVNLVQLSLSAGVFASMLLCLAHDPISGPGIEPQTEIAGDAAVRPLRIRSRVGLWLGLCGLGLVLLLVTANLTVVRALQTAPATQILGHRGDSDGGVENTIAGLDAAKAAGVDRVEMDVMETTDSKFVVMHDANLQRLADLDADVFDLTQEELTQIQVHDQLGHTETIPTFEEYVAHAQRIGMPLLIELKLHGHEHDAYMERFIAVLDEVNGFQDNIFHSLDRQRVEELKRARPGARVGYIMPFAALRLPATTADFYVLEQFSNTDDLMRQAHDAGKQYFIWTVDSTRAADDLMAQGVDALIVEHSADMVAERAAREDKIVPAAQALMNAFDRNLTLL